MGFKNRNKKLKWVLLLTVVLAVVAAVFILPGKGKPKPNVVVILIDTVRADHTSIHGYERDTTPNLKRIAKKGLKLENYFVNSPWTKPSVASIISGLHPTCHGSRVGQFDEMELYVVGTAKVEILNSKIETMAEILKKNAFSTHAYITNYHLTPRFGYHQGYNHYNFNGAGSDKKIVCGTDRDAIYNAMKILETRKGKPVFIWCHLMAVHGYCYPPDFDKFKPGSSPTLTPIPANAFQKRRVQEYDSIEEAVCSYDNAIFYSDALVGEFFDFICTKAPDTILIVTSDHGEEFYEHGGFEHCRTLYNEILKVPCVIYGPGVPTGVFTGLSDSIDLLPTIMKNLGIKISSDLRGQILFEQNQVSREGKKEIFAEQHYRGLNLRFALFRDGKKMIINQHKLTREISREFYHDGLVIEKENVFPTADKDIIKIFERRINRHKTVNKNYFRKKVGRPTYKNLSPEDIKHLRSLGYIE
ncbi:MAG: sulfatase [Candidatus Aminicenantes bacterium]|nr:sulfatase [Candidatus Aminicenantes bacterium]